VELALADSHTYDNWVISLTYRPTGVSDLATARQPAAVA
jgi:hypothetical protein